MASSLHPAVTKALSMASESRITYRSHSSQHLLQIGHETWHTVSFKNSCSLWEPVMLSFCNRPNSSLSNTLSSSGKGPVQAKLVRFKGRKDVCIPFQEGCLHPGAYLKETERIVKVTFPDSARIKYLGDSYWQARLQSITFFNFTATPYCDVRFVLPLDLHIYTCVCKGRLRHEDRNFFSFFQSLFIRQPTAGFVVLCYQRICYSVPL